MRNPVAYAVMIMLIALLTLSSVEEVGSQPFSDAHIVIEPSVPNSSADVEVTVSFDFDSSSPYVQKFGPPVQTGDTFSANVTVYVPGPEEYVIPVLHTDACTYNLGSIAVGGYVFRVNVHYNYSGVVLEMAWSKLVLFTVTFLGDVDHDYDVDIFDVIFCGLAYGTTPSSPNWNPYCDIAEPYGIINIFDIVTIAGNYGEEYTP